MTVRILIDGRQYLTEDIDVVLEEFDQTRRHFADDEMAASEALN
ncbi:MAG: hypothetical protein Q4E57_08770 [Eubacteriales bacterium]|nr:hypothetical protein [Eubacteriales bacterium]